MKYKDDIWKKLDALDEKCTEMEELRRSLIASLVNNESAHAYKNGGDSLTLTQLEFRILRGLTRQAVESGAEQFAYKGHVFLTSYAKHLITFLSHHFALTNDPNSKYLVGTKGKANLIDVEA
jgi:hypothetical protein